jgi:energy-coupling factor transport system substrate-specific component
VRGFIVGAVTAVISSFFLGFGLWTIFQILAWGLVGVFFGLLGKIMKHSSSWWAITVLAAMGLLWGYIFGFITNLSFIPFLSRPFSLETIITAQIMSFLFDTMHGVGNAILFGVFGKTVIRILKRFRERFLLL